MEKTPQVCAIFILNKPEFWLLMQTCKDELCKFLVEKKKLSDSVGTGYLGAIL